MRARIPGKNMKFNNSFRAPSVLFSGLGCIISAEVENEDARCEIMMKNIISNDGETATDNTASRLHSTWVSQE